RRSTSALTLASEQFSRRNADRSLESSSMAAPNKALTVSHFSGDVAMALFQVSVEPGFRYAPIPLDGFRRDAQDFCCFLDRESPEETKLDDLALPGIDGREPIQTFIQLQQFVGLLGGKY